MITAKEFRAVSCQVVFFTPGMQFSANHVFAWLLSNYGHVFDGEPTLLPNNPQFQFQGQQIDIPRIILRQSNGVASLQAGSGRLDLTLSNDPLEEIQISEFLKWCGELGNSYLKKFQESAGRIACVLESSVTREQPAVEIARHFCKERWSTAPLNRPQEFQIHSHKVYSLDGIGEINSWVRCLSGYLPQNGEADPKKHNTIAVVQDINTVFDEQSPRKMNESELTTFLDVVPQEMASILSLYFPEE